MGSVRTEATAEASLRDLIDEAGYTFDSLARAIRAIARENGHNDLRTNQSSVSHWVAGSTPAPTTRRYLAEALARRLGRPVVLTELGLRGQDPDEEDVGLTLTSDPIQTVSDLAAADLGRRAFLRGAAYSVLALGGPLAAVADDLDRGQRALTSPGTRWIGASDVEAVWRMTAAFNDLDERMGGEHGRATVVTYLAHDVTALCRGRFLDERVRRQMHSAAAQVAYLAGWKAHDAGLESLAQRYYLQAFALAQRGEGDTHAAWVLRIMSHHAIDIDRPDRCVELAAAAWDRAHRQVEPRTRAMLAMTRALAHARTGDRRSAQLWLNRGEAIIGTAAGEPSPYWADLGGPAENLVASHTAKAFAALGEHARAEPGHARAVARWNPNTHARVRALALSNLGRTQAAQGHIEQACHTWSEAIGPLQATRSARTRKALGDIRSTLAAPRYRRLSAVRELRMVMSS